MIYKSQVESYLIQWKLVVLDEVGTIATNLRELKMISVCVLYRFFNFFVGEDDVYILMLPWF